jgi:hypothetical protein
MIRFFLISICLLCVVNSSFAQGNLTGRVYENKTRIPVGGVSIENLRSHVTTVSDKNGLFSIRAHVGDLVTFSAFSYHIDTLYVKDLASVEILLDLRQTMLNDVKVTGSETKLGKLNAAPTLSPFGGHTLVYRKDDTGGYIGGLTLNVFDSHSNANKRKRDAQIGKDEHIKQEIADVFSPENLKNYVPLTGQEMDNFIILYTPPVGTYTRSDFNLTIYLDTAYKEFLKIPAEERRSKKITDLQKKPGQ